MKEKIVVLTGAGISAESGIQTFRDAGGLWEGHDVMEVATPEGFNKNPELVLEFYNQRRRQLLQCVPNEGHKALVQLEEKYDVTIITQNVDDLHERAGSSSVFHLHGELLKARSTGDPKLIYSWEKDITLQDKCEKGFQLRPNIVWFGEMVPMIDLAVEFTRKADILIVIGTSLVVYPAASLIHYTDITVQKYLIDPHQPSSMPTGFEFLPYSATIGVPYLVKSLLSK
jgi:NAD-dependent deacetylase